MSRLEMHNIHTHEWSIDSKIEVIF